jgi:hypothetical protein
VSRILFHSSDRTDPSVGNSDSVFDVPFVARHIPREPTNNLIQVQKWLGSCRLKHARCNNWCSKLGAKGHRPTRVLELSHSSLRLRCDLDNIEEFKYLALSHMWGEEPSKQLRLTSATLQEFQRDIPLDTLPSIFREAIQITHYLGFRYLWIDSLCIIQDSNSDWTAEANMMSAVYNNAVCTIAFLFPPHAGFSSTQNRRDPRGSTPCMVREPARSRPGVCAFPESILGAPRGVRTSWPLFSRAWTFQEQILSPRTIFYGNHTLKWECVEMSCDELAGTVAALTTTWDHKNMNQKALLSPQRVNRPRNKSGIVSQLERDDEFEEPFASWMELMRRYRKRDITQASDRIMAFAGIAQAFQAENDLTYLAGMWKEHLPRSLLWSIVFSVERTSSLTPIEPVLESAPTWSLFASSIYSNRHDAIYYEPIRREESVLFLVKVLHFRWPKAAVNFSPPTAYHDFQGLQITLEFITLDVSLLSKDEDPGSCFYGLRCSSLEARLASLFTVSGGLVKVSLWFDDFRSAKQPPTGIRIALVYEGWNGSSGQYHFEGLILGPGAKGDTWKRLGYCEGQIRSDLPEPTCCDLTSDNSSFKSLEKSIFVRVKGAKIETLTLI